MSTVVALTLSPALCSIILKSGVEKSDYKFIEKFDNWFNNLRDKYLSVGFDDYLSKPIDREELDRILKEFFIKNHE